MSLTIPDDVVDELRAKAPEALVEIACRLYDADKISKPQATRLAGLERVDFETELTKRGLPWIRILYDETYAEEFAQLGRERSAVKAQPGK